MSDSVADIDWDKTVYAQDYVIAICSYVVLTIMVCITAVLVTKLRSNHNQTHTTFQSETSANAYETDQQNHIKIIIITRTSIVAMLLYLLSVLLTE
eukprot:568533_1